MNPQTKLVPLALVSQILKDALSSEAVEGMERRLSENAVFLPNDQFELAVVMDDFLQKLKLILILYGQVVGELDSQVRGETERIGQSKSLPLFESLFRVLLDHRAIDAGAAQDLDDFLRLITQRLEAARGVDRVEEVKAKINEAVADFEVALKEVTEGKNVTPAEAKGMVEDLTEFLLRLLTDYRLVKSRLVSLDDLPPAARQAWEREFQKYWL